MASLPYTHHTPNTTPNPPTDPNPLNTRTHHPTHRNTHPPNPIPNRPTGVVPNPNRAAMYPTNHHPTCNRHRRVLPPHNNHRDIASGEVFQMHRPNDSRTSRGGSHPNGSIPPMLTPIATPLIRHRIPVLPTMRRGTPRLRHRLIPMGQGDGMANNTNNSNIPDRNNRRNSLRDSSSNINTHHRRLISNRINPLVRKDRSSRNDRGIVTRRLRCGIPLPHPVIWNGVRMGVWAVRLRRLVVRHRIRVGIVGG